VDRLTAATGHERWEIFSDLDQVLDAIARGADDRLAFQFRYPVVG
jgi:hypothetical protein